jgi:hypothetical protein
MNSDSYVTLRVACPSSLFHPCRIPTMGADLATVLVAMWRELGREWWLEGKEDQSVLTRRPAFWRAWT